MKEEIKNKASNDKAQTKAGGIPGIPVFMWCANCKTNVLVLPGSSHCSRCGGSQLSRPH